MGKLRFRKPKTDEYLGIPPVGIILAFSKEVSPAEIYGGTWEPCGQGKTLVGVNESDNDFIAPTTVIDENGNLSVTEKIGGEKVHTLTIAEMPTHEHTFSEEIKNTTLGSPYSTGNSIYCVPETKVGGNNGIYRVRANGGSQSHNNLQPYMTAYFWRRIA